MTLKPLGTNASSGNNGIGKITELPGSGLNKTVALQDSRFNGTLKDSKLNGTLQDSKLNGTLQNSKLNGKINGGVAHIDERPAKFDKRPAKSFSPVRVNSQPAGFRQGSGFTNGGNNFHMASSHGGGFGGGGGGFSRH